MLRILVLEDIGDYTVFEYQYRGKSEAYKLFKIEVKCFNFRKALQVPIAGINLEDKLQPVENSIAIFIFGTLLCQVWTVSMWRDIVQQNNACSNEQQYVGDRSDTFNLRSIPQDRCFAKPIP